MCFQIEALRIVFYKIVTFSKEETAMANKEAKKTRENFKTEIASELGIDLKKENLTTKEAGKVGGEMVRRMVESYENSHK